MLKSFIVLLSIFTIIGCGSAAAQPEPSPTTMLAPGDTPETAIAFEFDELLTLLIRDVRANTTSTKDGLMGKWVQVQGQTTGERGESGWNGDEFLVHSFDISTPQGHLSIDGRSYWDLDIVCRGRASDTTIRDVPVIPQREIEIVGIYSELTRLLPVLDWCKPTFPIWLNIPLSKSSAFFKPLSICETLAVGMAIITP